MGMSQNTASAKNREVRTEKMKSTQCSHTHPHTRTYIHKQQLIRQILWSAILSSLFPDNRHEEDEGIWSTTRPTSCFRREREVRKSELLREHRAVTVTFIPLRVCVFSVPSRVLYILRKTHALAWFRSSMQIINKNNLWQVTKIEILHCIFDELFHFLGFSSYFKKLIICALNFFMKCVCVCVSLRLKMLLTCPTQILLYL